MARRFYTVAEVAAMAASYLRGASLTDVSRMTGVPISTVRSRLLSFGVDLRTPVAGMILKMPERSAKMKGRKRGPMAASSRELLRQKALARGERFAAGRSLKPSGYIEITRGPNKGRHEHDVIMEQAIGRPLLPEEVVHHIDENKTNNELSNLQLMTRSAHAALHRWLRRERNASGRAQ